MTDATHSYSACGSLVPGDLGLKVLLCPSPDGTQGEVSFLPIAAWVTLTEVEAGAPERYSWSWQPVVLFEHALCLARRIPDYRGTVAKDVNGKVALDLVKSRALPTGDVHRSHSPTWASNLQGL
jgi:hypothetical protein